MCSADSNTVFWIVVRPKSYPTTKPGEEKKTTEARRERRSNIEHRMS